jgi:hypothetical protein
MKILHDSELYGIVFGDAAGNDGVDKGRNN